jgi:sec-independent protein translocase protein TatA
MDGIGWPELLIIGGVLIVLFGSKKLPDAARSLGRSMRIMKTEIKGLHEDEKPAAPAELATAQPANTEPVSTEQSTTTS